MNIIKIIVLVVFLPLGILATLTLNLAILIILGIVLTPLYLASQFKGN